MGSLKLFMYDNMTYRLFHPSRVSIDTQRPPAQKLIPHTLDIQGLLS